MRTLTNTPLFGMFTSYVEGSELMPGNLPAAYDDFVGLLTNLPQDGDTVGQLRRLNYTRIELSFMRQTSDVLKEKRHVLYDVFIDKVLSLLDAEIEMLKECLRHYTDDAGTGWYHFDSTRMRSGFSCFMKTDAEIQAYLDQGNYNYVRTVSKYPATPTTPYTY